MEKLALICAARPAENGLAGETPAKSSTATRNHPDLLLLDGEIPVIPQNQHHLQKLT